MWGCISGSATRQWREGSLPLLWCLRNCICSTVSSSDHPGTKKTPQPPNKKPPHQKPPKLNPKNTDTWSEPVRGPPGWLGAKAKLPKEQGSFKLKKQRLRRILLLSSGCRGDRARLCWVVSSGSMRGTGTNSNRGSSYEVLRKNNHNEGCKTMEWVTPEMRSVHP